jgi:phasin family protein
MSINSLDALAEANKAAADTFLQMSTICLEGIERLVSLNLSTLRDAVEGGAAAAASLGEVRSAADIQAMQSGLTPLVDSTMAYSLSFQEIAAKTQQDLTALISAQLSTQLGAQFSQMNFKPGTSAAWNEALELFSRSAQQMVASTSAKVAAANIKAVNPNVKATRKAA